MTFMEPNVPLDTSHHGPPHPCKDAGAIAESLTGMPNAMVKRLFVVSRSRINNSFRCPRRQTSRGFKSGECGGHAVGPPLPVCWPWYVLRRTSRTAHLACTTFVLWLPVPWFTMAENAFCSDSLLQTIQRESEGPEHTRLLQTQLINKQCRQRLNIPLISGGYTDEQNIWTSNIS
jgi:hypothetical protein